MRGVTKTLSGPAQPQSDSVLPSLARSMDVDLVVNELSEVWVLHDKPFPGTLEWAEYDADLNSFTLVTDKGRIQPLGMTIPPLIAERLKGAVNVNAFLVENEKITDLYIVPMIVHETGLQ